LGGRNARGRHAVDSGDGRTDITSSKRAVSAREACLIDGGEFGAPGDRGAMAVG
jgi:hypothetical protein